MTIIVILCKKVFGDSVFKVKTPRIKMDSHISIDIVSSNHYWARLSMEWEPHAIDIQDEILHCQILDSYPNQKALENYYHDYQNQRKGMADRPRTRVQGCAKRPMGKYVSVHPGVSQEKRRRIFAEMVNGPPSLRSLNHSAFDDETARISSPPSDSTQTLPDVFNCACDTLDDFLVQHPRLNDASERQERLDGIKTDIDGDEAYESEKEEYLQDLDLESDFTDVEDEILHRQILDNYPNQKAIRNYYENFRNQTRSLPDLLDLPRGMQRMGKYESIHPNVSQEKRRMIFADMVNGPPSWRSLSHSAIENDTPSLPSTPGERLPHSPS